MVSKINNVREKTKNIHKSCDFELWFIFYTKPPEKGMVFTDAIPWVMVCQTKTEKLLLNKWKYNIVLLLVLLILKFFFTLGV